MTCNVLADSWTPNLKELHTVLPLAVDLPTLGRSSLNDPPIMAALVQLTRYSTAGHLVLSAPHNPVVIVCLAHT